MGRVRVAGEAGRKSRPGLREIIRAAGLQGWRAEKGSRHWKLYSPDGEAIVVAAATPRGGRWKANLIAELRRHGVEWKGR